MNTERFKSIILFSLVIISFILTTRIWFYISIEGLFDIPLDKNAKQVQLTYDKENLLKPNKLIVHTELNHTLLFNNKRDKDYYSFILNGSKDTMRDWLSNYQSYTSNSLSIDKLDSIRSGEAVELIFQPSIALDSLKSLLYIENDSWKNIKTVSSIIISPYDNKIYIVDASKGNIEQFASPQMPVVLKGVIAELKKRNDFAYVFLNIYNDPDKPAFYSDFAVVPTSITSMPVLKVKKEAEPDTKVTSEVASFFDEDSSRISSMKDESGTVTYTDREEETFKIHTNGAMEYYRYNITSDDVGYTSVNEALNLATEYVNKHLGFTYDFYLSGVDGERQGGRNSYVISYNYRYDGIPIITEAEAGKNKSAVEVEILGNEVKRYNRNVKIIAEEEKTVKIKSFAEALDIMFKLDKHLRDKKSESILKVNDMYLSYFERNDMLIPMWTVDVNIQSSDNSQYGKKYFIGAEEGAILGEQ